MARGWALEKNDSLDWTAVEEQDSDWELTKGRWGVQCRVRTRAKSAGQTLATTSSNCSRSLDTKDRSQDH